MSIYRQLLRVARSNLVARRRERLSSPVEMTPITETPLPGEGAGADLMPGAVVGEYRVEEKIGEGGFGAVYRAVHPMIGKSAAVKVLSATFSASPELSARFLNEARAVNRINHGNIVDIFSFGTLPDGRLYFVMELLSGEPLDGLLDRIVRLPFEDAMPILRAVASAVDAAHEAGIVHRDLKPENVFLAKESNGGFKVKLLDFGIAKVATEEGPSHRTRTGEILGSPYYMSPEQARGQPIDARSDVYSFGAMIHRILTGTVPFSGSSTIDIVLAHVTTPPPPMSLVHASLPAALDAPVLAMLCKQPGGRPASLGSGLDQLARAASSVGLDAEKSPGSVMLPSSSVTDRSHQQVTAAFAATDISAVGQISNADTPTPARGLWQMAVAGLGIAVLGAGAAAVLLRGRTNEQRGPDPAALSATAPASPASATGATSAPSARPADSADTAAPAALPSGSSPQILPAASSAAPVVRVFPKARPKPINADLERPP